MKRYYLPWIMLLFSFVGNAQISVNNTSSPSTKAGYYNWTIFVQADDATLNTIDHVEYLLDPTFSNPQVSSFNRANKFSYSSTGWGEFDIKVKIVFRNRKSPQYIPYRLKLRPAAVIRNVRVPVKQKI